jgi:hypothetical protein
MAKNASTVCYVLKVESKLQYNDTRRSSVPALCLLCATCSRLVTRRGRRTMHDARRTVGAGDAQRTTHDAQLARGRRTTHSRRGRRHNAQSDAQRTVGAGRTTHSRRGRRTTHSRRGRRTTHSRRGRRTTHSRRGRRTTQSARATHDAQSPRCRHGGCSLGLPRCARARTIGGGNARHAGRCDVVVATAPWELRTFFVPAVMCSRLVARRGRRALRAGHRRGVAVAALRLTRGAGMGFCRVVRLL